MDISARWHWYPLLALISTFDVSVLSVTWHWNPLLELTTDAPFIDYQKIRMSTMYTYLVFPKTHICDGVQFDSVRCDPLESGTKVWNRVIGHMMSCLFWRDFHETQEKYISGRKRQFSVEISPWHPQSILYLSWEHRFELPNQIRIYVVFAYLFRKGWNVFSCNNFITVVMSLMSHTMTFQPCHHPSIQILVVNMQTFWYGIFVNNINIFLSNMLLSSDDACFIEYFIMLVYVVAMG